MSNLDDEVTRFFDRYAAALLARDARTIAAMYATPGLVVFPGRVLPIASAAQTEAFFASSWGQYEGVDEVDNEVVIIARAPGTIWADVTWSYGGSQRERFCYQLIEGEIGLQIVVLTPMALA
jgi:ketosteroid isomerase-like protein